MDWSERPTVGAFFYGSYMDPGTRPLPRRAGVGIEVCRLADHRLLVDPIARIVHAPDRSVYGTLEQISPEDLEALYSRGPMSRYRTLKIQVERAHGTAVDAVTYTAATPVVLKADPGYGERLLVIARDVGLPASYVDEVARLTAPRHHV